MYRRRLNQRALKRSFFASIAKLLSVGLGAGAGSLIHQLAGGGLSGWGAALVLSGVSFMFMLIAEYKKETE